MQLKSKTLKIASHLLFLRRVALFSFFFCLAVFAHSATLNNLFFLHHSTGNGLITGGNMRSVITSYNTAHGTSFAFWDHGYNSDGLRDPDGNVTGTSYEIPNDNTDPEGLYYLWTSTESDATTCRNTILSAHQVIAFKSCFPASDIADTEALNQRKTWYLGMRNVFDQHQDHLFVVMSTPPLHRLATTSTAADNARQFANWLKSQEYVGGHTNVVCFDLFDYLAGSDNMLKYEYEGSHEDSDSHPNDTANQTVGPTLVNFLISSALGYNATNSPTPIPPSGLGTPTIRANGTTNEITVSYPETVCITVEMSAGQSAGTEADWWVIVSAQSSGEWYYLNGNMEWMGFNGDLALCQPAYQGPLFNLSATTVLREYTLPQGTFMFYFAVDQRDDILNYPDGPIEYNMVTVVVQESGPVPQPDPASLIQPTDLVYLGAFRLPEDPALPGEGWEWGGLSLAYYSAGDPSGPSDGHPGSLYGTGNAQRMWVGEVNIPAPEISTATNLSELNTATLLRGFTDIRLGISSLEQLYENRMLLYAGLEYLPAQGAQTSAKLYACFGDHFHDPGTPQYTPSHMWTDLDLQNNHSGAWWISTQSLYSVNQYIFELPAAWADANDATAGRYLVTGRYREGGWSGQGPALFAIAPWLSGNPPAADEVLPAFPLLLYSNTRGDDPTSYTVTNYHHSDNWYDGACLTVGDKSAVVFVGLKGQGNCWYGYSDGTVVPTDGSEGPPAPPYPNNDRGWWSTSFQAQIIFYNPTDFAAVAAGSMAAYQPQPYATFNLDPYLWNIDKVNHPDFNVNQNKYRVGGCAFDRASGLLYIAEDRGDVDTERPLIHVFRVN